MLVVCTAAACGFVGALYQNATSLIVLEADSYFDLNDVQEAAGKTRTDALMAWHKRDVLPLYVKQLRTVAAQIEQGLDASQVSSTYDWGMGELRRVTQYAAPQQLELLSSLSEKQIAYLQKKLAKDNAKYRKEWVSASLDDAKALRFDKYLTWVERIYGTFNGEQRQQLRKLSDARTFNPKQGYDERIARQNAFVSLIKTLSKNDAPQAQAQLATFVASLEKPTDYAANNRRELQQLIAATSQIATPEQRSTAKTKLLDYADTFESIARGR